jgi:hypothetical protein
LCCKYTASHVVKVESVAVCGWIKNTTSRIVVFLTELGLVPENMYTIVFTYRGITIVGLKGARLV